jgi:hypothetical protein
MDVKKYLSIGLIISSDRGKNSIAVSHTNNPHKCLKFARVYLKNGMVFASSDYSKEGFKVFVQQYLKVGEKLRIRKIKEMSASADIV